MLKRTGKTRRSTDVEGCLMACEGRHSVDNSGSMGSDEALGGKRVAKTADMESRDRKQNLQSRREGQLRQIIDTTDLLT